jgi:hypothetical protein
MRKIRVKAEQAGASDGDGPDEHTSSAVTHRMLMLSRPGRVRAAGVYAYADDRGTGLWCGLAETSRRSTARRLSPCASSPSGCSSPRRSKPSRAPTRA